MAMKLPTFPTQGPMRGLPLTIGSLPAAAFLILARPRGESASPERSGTTLDRSRMRPSASRIPGFSRPGGPKRKSFMGVPLCRIGGETSKIAASCVAPRRRTSGADGLAAASERPRKQAAVDQQVLSRDVAGVCRAQERAGIAELVGLAEALGRDGGGARRHGLVERHALLLGVGLDVGAQAVGVEGAG